MAPNVEDMDAVRLNMEGAAVAVHGGRILPEERPPAQAWVDLEGDTGSPGESRRLLPIQCNSRLQAGLTLGLHNQKSLKYPPVEKSLKKHTTKFQRRREWLIAALKPPYFIVSMIIVFVFLHAWGSERLRGRLEWAPGAWWREPWRLLTYSCVHASPTHLTLNALVALAVGWRLEREQGWWRVAGAWCGGAAAGALGAGALQSQVSVVGASAAVYALLTAHLPNVCLRFGHIPLWWFRPLSVLVLGTSEGCWALLRSSSAPPPPPIPLGGAYAQASYERVAWSAHVFGAAAGVPLAFIFFTGENEGNRYILLGRILSGLVLLAGVVAAAVYYTLAYEMYKK